MAPKTNGTLLPVDLVTRLATVFQVGDYLIGEQGEIAAVRKEIAGRQSVVVTFSNGDVFECTVRKLSDPPITPGVSPVEGEGAERGGGGGYGWRS